MAKKSNKKKKETELQKALKWINSLSGERAEFIREFANWQSKKEMKNTLNVLDRCMSAAIINVLDLEWDVIEEIQNNMVHFLEDDTKKMGENKVIYGGLEMATKKINEQEKLVEKRVNELIDQGTKQNEMVKILTMEFSMLSKAMLTNAIKRVKSGRLKTTEDAAKYILEESKKLKEKVEEEAKEIAKSVADNLENELEDLDNISIDDGLTVPEEVKEEKEMVKGLEILEEVVVKTVKAKGNNGIYEAKTGVGVALENEGYKVAFKSVDELNEFYNEFKKMFEVI